MMFRPRDSHDLRLVETGLRIVPQPATIRWLHDVFSNSIAVVDFDAEASELSFESTIVTELYRIDVPEFTIDDYARELPFAYPREEIPDIGRTIERHDSDPDRVVDAWARRFLDNGEDNDTWRVLLDMTQAIANEFTYVTRYEPGIQSAVDTVRTSAGTCRDFAYLLMEAVRSLGLAARFATGYLYDPAIDGGTTTMTGAGATHAWTQVYLPGAGWVELDPTNGLAGGSNLIRVAVARDPSQAIPLHGAYIGQADDFLEMLVDVRVSAEMG